MNISSIVIHAHPADTSVLEGKLSVLPGVDIHAVMDDGKMIVSTAMGKKMEMPPCLMQVIILTGMIKNQRKYHPDGISAHSVM